MNRKIATFFMDNTLLGVDILLVKEVNRNITLTPIPDANSTLRGLMNLRGKVVTVIDLNVCLNRPVTKSIEECRLLILKTDEEIVNYQNGGMLIGVKLGEDIIGFLINQMADVFEVQDEDILQPPPNLTLVDKELVEGVIKRGKQLVILLNVTAILDKVLSASTKIED
ncbi:MAG: chemotaxis protein CheW [Desulfobacterales bacterium]|nr:chemotaxis protein CheW [Desulfobacterales bacterium]